MRGISSGNEPPRAAPRAVPHYSRVPTSKRMPLMMQYILSYPRGYGVGGWVKTRNSGMGTKWELMLAKYWRSNRYDCHGHQNTCTHSHVCAHTLGEGGKDGGAGERERENKRVRGILQESHFDFNVFMPGQALDNIHSCSRLLMLSSKVPTEFILRKKGLLI